MCIHVLIRSFRIYVHNNSDKMFKTNARVDKYDQVLKEERLVAVNAIKAEASRRGLSALEELQYKDDKVEELDKEINRRRPTTAISFKEWVRAAKITLPDGMDIDDCKRHDCCGDEI